MTNRRAPPGDRECEISLIGPGYGECVVLHIGGGAWVVVDSCVDAQGPRALQYLESIGLDPAQAVALIVATHWHDDHMRGMSKLVQVCNRAAFCCAAALCEKELLAKIYALADRHHSEAGSGVGEIYRTFAQLKRSKSKPIFALANRRIFAQGPCEIWSLSPSDSAFQNFLASLGSLMPKAGQAKIRLPSLSPNKVAVVLWIRVEDVVMLLGSDMESQGWMEILQSGERSTDRASVFKVPHHGSAGADHPSVWRRLLVTDPYAMLTPWRRGGQVLPTRDDARRILSHTVNAYATSRELWSKRKVHRPFAVEKTIHSAGATLRIYATSAGMVRLRRPLGSQVPWQVEKFGPACHLENCLF